MFKFLPDDKSEGSKEISWFPAEEVMPDQNHLEKLDTEANISSVTLGRWELKHFNRDSALDVIKGSEKGTSICDAEEQHSDLIAGIYEGGLKIWECTSDMAQFLSGKDSQFTGKNILDLGCGAGLLGILALKLGAQSVTFQDYNRDVLQYWTIPNVFLNRGSTEGCRFWSGDWEHFVSASKTKFDLILSSETIYNPDNHVKLRTTLEETLAEDGIIYIAGKSYYFGVGGSMKQFESQLDEGGKLSSKVVWKSEQGCKVVKI